MPRLWGGALMPTTEQQRRAIAYLTRTSRDGTHNAPAFDEPGIMAALSKVRHLDVGTVTMAAMRCAADPSVKTPAMIGDPSSSVYRERLGPPTAPRHTRPMEACSHCGNLYGPSCCNEPTPPPRGRPRGSQPTEEYQSARANRRRPIEGHGV